MRTHSILTLLSIALALSLSPAPALAKKHEPPVPITRGEYIAPRPSQEIPCTWQREFGGFARTTVAIQKLAAGQPLTPRERTAFDTDGRTLRPEVLATARAVILAGAPDAADANAMAEAYSATLSAE